MLLHGELSHQKHPHEAKCVSRTVAATQTLTRTAWLCLALFVYTAGKRLPHERLNAKARVTAVDFQISRQDANTHILACEMAMPFDQPRLFLLITRQQGVDHRTNLILTAVHAQTPEIPEATVLYNAMATVIWQGCLIMCPRFHNTECTCMYIPLLPKRQPKTAR